MGWCGGGLKGRLPPKKGQIVQVPPGAKAEPARKKNGNRAVEAPGNSLLPVEDRASQMARAVALKAAALVLSGKDPSPEEVISLAEKFESWLRSL